jgi:hypothetical protein
MINVIILLALLFIVMILSYRISPKKYRRLKRRQLAKRIYSKDGTLANDPSKKAALNIPGYYEDVVNKDKLKKAYKWELHESF